MGHEREDSFGALGFSNAARKPQAREKGEKGAEKVMIREKKRGGGGDFLVVPSKWIMD
jgi:hypothetical protein